VCEDRDREGLLCSLRSGEFERALPSLADLETIATHKHAPVCERTTTLLRLAYEPWGVLRRHLWPRSFRGGVAAVMNAGGELDDGIRFTVLSFCGRDWWAGGHRPGASAPSVLQVPLSRRMCDGCQRCPMDRATELKRCSGCRAVYYCTRVDEGGKAACQHAAWGGHKKACKKATRARARREEVEAAVAAGAAAAAATAEAAAAAAAAAEGKKIAKAKKQAARKKEQKKRRKRQLSV
jgi:hypothetical protein